MKLAFEITIALTEKSIESCWLFVQVFCFGFFFSSSFLFFSRDKEKYGFLLKQQKISSVLIERE